MKGVELPEQATVRMAIDASALLEAHPSIDLTKQRVGVFGRVVSLDAPLADGDRVEVYRPLMVDPKEARKARAARSAKRRA